MRNILRGGGGQPAPAIGDGGVPGLGVGGQPDPKIGGGGQPDSFQITGGGGQDTIPI